MNLKKLKDSINAIKQRRQEVDYEDHAVSEVAGTPFGKSKILTTDEDDHVLFVLIGDNDPNEVASLWKVPNRRKVGYHENREYLAEHINNQADLEDLAEWYEMPVEEVKNDLQDCYDNFDTYMNQLVDKLKENMGDRSF